MPTSMRIAVVVAALILAPLGLAQSAQPGPFAGEDVTLPAPPPERFVPLADPTPIPRSSWKRYFTRDALDRVVVFYVRTPSEQAKPDAPSLPVVVFVQGSGSQSVFTRVDTSDGVRYSASGGQGSLAQACAGRAIVVIAEKVGVRFAENPEHPGGAEGGSPTFRQEHTLDRWSAAVGAALRAALALPHADRTRVLVAGHSEGGLVACKVAADNPEVTHVATLAGGGPTQLFDLVELARRGDMCGGGTGGDECAARMYAMWDEVLKDPDSSDRFFLGHPHRRWSSFLRTSPSEQLERTHARVFIAQGTEDRAVFPAGADMLYATLRARGRDVTYARVEGDHGFMKPGADGAPDVAGWQAMHDRVARWFLEP